MRYKLVQHLSGSNLYTKACDSIEEALMVIAKDKSKSTAFFKIKFYLYDETDYNCVFEIVKD